MFHDGGTRGKYSYQVDMADLFGGGEKKGEGDTTSFGFLMLRQRGWLAESHVP